MTFEEAVKELNKLFEFPDVPEHIANDYDYEFVGSQCDVIEIIEKLQVTYASKIKMTFEQKDELMQFLDEIDFGFETFWFCLGSGSNLYIDFSENELMQAWLHQELIEVEE